MNRLILDLSIYLSIHLSFYLCRSYVWTGWSWTSVSIYPSIYLFIYVEATYEPVDSWPLYLSIHPSIYLCRSYVWTGWSWTSVSGTMISSWSDANPIPWRYTLIDWLIDWFPEWFPGWLITFINSTLPNVLLFRRFIAYNYW